MESKTPPATDLLASARERIRIGPVPPWAQNPPFALDFKPRHAGHVTHLFLDRQVHAERRQTHVRTVTRLETMQAVQHESQWRHQFEPNTQSVTVHWIKIVRERAGHDQARLDKFQVTQRAEGPEGGVMDGWITLSLLLEDVRPGDVLDTAYTIESNPPLLPERCFSFFALPQNIPVGKFLFSVRFDASRPLKWKSSSRELKPLEERSDREVVWSWIDSNHDGSSPEPNTPEWHLCYPWIQISDCHDWGTVATAFSRAWLEKPDSPAPEEIMQEMERESDPLLRIGKAIRLVQDEYRCLSFDLELRAHVPCAPGIVAQRRFGDCMDLSFLLVHLLRRLGVTARPVLVNTVLRKSIGDLLPTPGLFNHVVVEYLVAGERRWVDATLKAQGGGPLERVIPDFGFGLPVDATAPRLIEPPRASVRGGSIELKETILLETDGEVSLLAVVFTARGARAEAMRQEFELKGQEEFARERLQLCAQRFPTAKRDGPLQHRDDRAANEFVLAEVFEIRGLLLPHEQPGFRRLPIPNSIVLNALTAPEQAARRTPFALPYPCHIVHLVEVQSPSLQPASFQRSNIRSPHILFSRAHKSLNSYWSVTLTLSTLADAVQPAEIEDHRQIVEEVGRECMWEVVVEAGYARPRRRSDFGELPSPRRGPFGPRAVATAPSLSRPGPTAVSTSQSTGPGRPQADPSGSQTIPPPRPRRKNESRHRRRNRKLENILWLAIIGVVVIGLVMVFIFAARYHRR